jgi:hypothetical protein
LHAPQNLKKGVKWRKMVQKSKMASVSYPGTAKESTCKISAHLIKLCKDYAKNGIFCMKLSLPMAISRKGSGQF